MRRKQIDGVVTAVVLFAFVGQSVSAANLPGYSRPITTTILETHENDSKIHSALEIYEGRVRRWLEDGLKVQVNQRLAPSKELQDILELEVLSQRLNKNQKEGLGSLELKRKEVWSRWHAGPTVLRAMATEKYAWNQLGNKKNARQVEVDALRIAQVAQLSSKWDSVDTDEGVLGFLKESRKSTQAFSCRVELAIAENLDFAIFVDGFSLAKSSHILLPVGTSHRIQLALSNGKSFEVTLPCDRVSSESISLDKFVAAEIAARNPTIVVSAKGSTIELSLFSALRGIEPVNAKRALGYAEVLADPFQNDIPIATHLFSQQLEKHFPRNEGMTFALAEPNSDASFSKNLSETVAPYRWYNDWKVWTVIGGIAAGSAIAFISLRNNQIQSQGGIRISFD